jgi:serine/threonine-protein kinase
MLVGWPLDQAQEGRKPRPAPLAPSLLRTGLPVAVDDLVLRALDLDARRRYPGPGALADDCARFLATRPDPRRALRMLLDQLQEGELRPPGDEPTRLAPVPWRDGEAAAPSPPAVVLPRARRLRWWRPWMTRLGVRVLETTIASLVALAALQALSARRQTQPDAHTGAAHPSTVIVPLARP